MSLGSTWLVDELMGDLIKVYETANTHLEKITALIAYANIMKSKLDHPKVGGSFADTFYNCALSGARDSVPNVRIVAARTLAEVLRNLNADTGTDEGMALLESLCDDVDVDVRFEAKQQLEVLHKSNSGESKDAPMVVN